LVVNQEIGNKQKIEMLSGDKWGRVPHPTNTTKMSLITLTHGSVVQLKNLDKPWYELVRPDTVQEIQAAEIELGSSLVAERTNARMLEQIANGAEKAHCGQFKFHLVNREGCLQSCRIVERLARIELLELDAAVQIQKMWRGMKGRERYVEWWAHRWWGRECAAVKIQRVWRGFTTRKGKTPNSWWIEPLRGWNKQVCCPHRSMFWVHAPEAGPPL